MDLLETIFSVANTLALIGWILLALIPESRAARYAVISGAISLVFAAAYIAVLGSGMPYRGGFGTLAAVAELFSDRRALLAGWIHYLAFDLFIGVWETRDARINGINRWLMIPFLFVTFMFGPAGLFAYYIFRALKTKKFFLQGDNS